MVSFELTILLVLYIQLNVVKALSAPRLIIDHLALYIRNHLALKEPRYRTLHLSLLHLILNIVHQDTTQLLDIMLHERVQSLPAKGPCQLLCSDGLFRKLEVIEYSLQAEWYTLDGVVGFSRKQVNGSTQLIGKKQSLQERVHVAGSTLIG